MVAMKIYYSECSLLIFTDENYETQDIITTYILKDEVHDEVIKLFIEQDDSTVLMENISKYQELTCEKLGCEPNFCLNESYENVFANLREMDS